MKDCEFLGSNFALFLTASFFPVFLSPPQDLRVHIEFQRLTVSSQTSTQGLYVSGANSIICRPWITKAIWRWQTLRRTVLSVGNIRSQKQYKYGLCLWTLGLVEIFRGRKPPTLSGVRFALIRQWRPSLQTVSIVSGELNFYTHKFILGRGKDMVFREAGKRCDRAINSLSFTSRPMRRQQRIWSLQRSVPCIWHTFRAVKEQRRRLHRQSTTRYAFFSRKIGESGLKCCFSALAFSVVPFCSTAGYLRLYWSSPLSFTAG